MTWEVVSGRARASPGDLWCRCNESFSLEYPAHLFEAIVDVTLTKSNLTKPVDIRKLGAAILEKNHRPLKPEATLEEPGLVNHVLTCVSLPSACSSSAVRTRNAIEATSSIDSRRVVVAIPAGDTRLNSSQDKPSRSLTKSFSARHKGDLPWPMKTGPLVRGRGRESVNESCASGSTSDSYSSNWPRINSSFRSCLLRSRWTPSSSCLGVPTRPEAKPTRLYSPATRGSLESAFQK